jgi:hypothetical protein
VQERLTFAAQKFSIERMSDLCIEFRFPEKSALDLESFTRIFIDLS